MEIRVENAAAMAEGECRVFEFPRNGRQAQGFVIRYRGAFRAYLNQCCHWPVPLDLGDADFYYAAIERITCKTHGATYDPATGFCDSGPCFRANLETYPAAASGNDCVVTVPG